MGKLLNDQMLDVTVMNQIQENDSFLVLEQMLEEQESLIGSGNLQDYLEIYGEQDDNY